MILEMSFHFPDVLFLYDIYSINLRCLLLLVLCYFCHWYSHANEFCRKSKKKKSGGNNANTDRMD